MQYWMLSLTAVVLMFLTVTKGGESPTEPLQIVFLGQSLFLFSPKCGQSHSEASGLKDSWSIILILHCKQTGSVLLRWSFDTEISSLLAETEYLKKCFEKT